MLVELPQNGLLKPQDVMKILRISKAGFYRLINGRKIPFFMVGGSIRIHEKDILTFLENNRVEPVHKDKRCL